MARMSVTVPHRLTQEDAIDRVRQAADKLHDRDGDRVSDFWNDLDRANGRGRFGLRIGRIPAAGFIEVRPSDVRIDVDLPMSMLPLQDEIEQTLRQEAERVLECRSPGAADDGSADPDGADE